MATITITIPEELYARMPAQLRASLDAFVAEAIRERIESEPPAFEPVTPEESERLPREEQDARIRAALGKHLADPHAWDSWLEELGGPMTEEEEEAFFASLPVLDPPLSESIIRAREEERY